MNLVKEENQVIFEGFCTLNCNDNVLRKDNKNVQHKPQPNSPDNDSDLNNDILKLASKVSNKLTSMKDRFKFKGFRLPVDIQVSPCVKKTLHVESEDVEMSVRGGNPGDEMETSFTKVKKKSSKKLKHGVKSSEDDTVNTDDADRSVTIEEFNNNASTNSPSLSAETDTSSPRKNKKHKSPKKRKKNDDDVDKHHGQIELVTQWSSEEDVGEPRDKVVNQNIKYKVPQEFACSKSAEMYLCSEAVGNGSELWLIKAPVDLDISRLNGQEISLDEKRCLQVEEDSVDAVAVPGDITGVSYCPLLPYKKSGKLSVGNGFCGQLHLTTGVTVPVLPPVEVPRPSHITTPADLRPRYVPFGAVSDNVNLKHRHKKAKKHKYTSPDLDEHDEKVKHKHKKAKKEKESSLDEVDSIPQKHKKKKKHKTKS